MPKKKKTYIVPTIVRCSFGCEMEVEATSKVEAKRLVQEGHGTIANDAGFDWNRFAEDSHEIGDWQPIEIQKD